MVTYNDAEVGNNENSSASIQLVLSSVLLNFDTHIRYLSCENFTIEMLPCPKKTPTKDMCSGRFLFDISKHVVANMKKAFIIVDEWLVQNEKSLGIACEDVYKHLILNGD